MCSRALPCPQILALNKDRNGKLTRKVNQKRPFKKYIYTKYFGDWSKNSYRRDDVNYDHKSIKTVDSFPNRKQEVKRQCLEETDTKYH